MDTHELKGDIRHRRDQTGQSDSSSERGIIKAFSHEIRGGQVAGFVTNRPESGHDGEDKRIDHDRIGNSEKSVSADAVHECRHGNHGVGRVKVATEQKPSDNDTEPSPTQSPFVEQSQITGPPARRDKPKDGYKQKQRDKDGSMRASERHPHHFALPAAMRRNQARSPSIFESRNGDSCGEKNRSRQAIAVRP